MKSLFKRELILGDKAQVWGLWRPFKTLSQDLKSSVFLRVQELTERWLIWTAATQLQSSQRLLSSVQVRSTWWSPSGAWLWLPWWRSSAPCSCPWGCAPSLDWRRRSTEGRNANCLPQRCRLRPCPFVSLPVVWTEHTQKKKHVWECMIPFSKKKDAKKTT